MGVYSDRDHSGRDWDPNRDRDYGVDAVTPDDLPEELTGREGANAAIAAGYLIIASASAAMGLALGFLLWGAG